MQPLAMISRTRLIITALRGVSSVSATGPVNQPVASVGCCRRFQTRQPSSRPHPDSASSPGFPLKTSRLRHLSRPHRNLAAASPEINVVTDDGQRDQRTEQIIQQELQSSSDQELGPPRPAINVPLGRNEVLIRADEQEKNQDIYKGRGHVEIRFRTYILHCDEATYDSTTGQVTATGHVVFDGGPHNEHLVGTHATYDVSRDTGTFYDVTGSTGVRVKNNMMFLTSSTPFFFTGQGGGQTRPRPLPRPSRLHHFLPVTQAQVGVQCEDRDDRNG